MDTKALADRLANLQSSGSNRPKILFSPKEEVQTIRVLPYPHQNNGEPFIEYYFHYDIAGHRSLVCPKKMYGRRCPICELADEFKDMGGKDNWGTYMDLSAKLRTYSPILIRGREDEGVFLWGYGKNIYENLLQTALDPEWGDFTDPETGLDIDVWMIPKGAPGNEKGKYPRPDMRFKRKESPLAKTKKESLALMDNIPNIVEEEEVFPCKSLEELLEIVKKYGEADEDQPEPDTSEGTEYGSDDSSESTDDSTDDEAQELKDRLNQLLNKKKE